MTKPAYNTVAWFQVASDKPDEAKRFFAELFGWRFVADPEENGRYDLVGYPNTDGFAGGIFHTLAETPNHAIFAVVVEDVRATVAKAEELGGKVVVAPTATSNGLVSAELLDSSGNLFGVFSPPTS
jgi:uncharacterized protein